LINTITIMKRYAAHYILLLPNDEVFKQHYIELDDNNQIVKIAPLVEEIEGVAFYNGTLLVVATGRANDAIIYHLDGINLSTAELSASNSSGNCHIQRL